MLASARAVVPAGREEDVELLGATFERAIAALTLAGQADRERLAANLAQLGELAAGLAHELRNGMATLTGYLSLIEREPQGGTVAGYLVEIRRETDHLMRVLEDFLSFARPESLRLESLDVEALLARAAHDPALGEVSVELATPTTPLPAIAGDPHLLERALRNLLHNAARAHSEAGAGGPIEVTPRVAAEGLEIAIADRGRGLPEGPVEHLFQPFVSGRAGGVGLGLPLAQRIVALHGGTLRLEARPDGPGAQAVLTLPFDTIDTKGN
jgi:signal transduction histidine kinase